MLENDFDLFVFKLHLLDSYLCTYICMLFVGTDQHFILKKYMSQRCVYLFIYIHFFIHIYNVRWPFLGNLLCNTIRK